jgi:hemerythrin-like metal-binding protein
MKTFVWDQRYITGLELVDQQHQPLVELINQLGESLIAGEVVKPEPLQVIFGQLTDYAKHHFAEEGRLMQKIGVDPRHRDPHYLHHVQFVEQLATMWNSRSSMTNPAEILHGFLRSWLGFHIGYFCPSPKKVKLAKSPLH